MTPLFKYCTLLIVAAAALVAANGDAHCQCTAFKNPERVCNTFKGTTYKDGSCVFPASNKYGPGAFDNTCTHYFGHSNCGKDNQPDRQID